MFVGCKMNVNGLTKLYNRDGLRLLQSCRTFRIQQPLRNNKPEDQQKQQSPDALNHESGKYPRTVFSGIQPTGMMHLGNYLGALRKWKEMQNMKQSVSFCIVDMHSITLPQQPPLLRENIIQMAATMLACGIDPEHSTIFIQSAVKEHCELSWILNCLTTMARLSHLPQYKEKTRTLKDIPLGLYLYPVLQAADILLYKTTHVPVGEDQIQHIQLAQHLARTFNTRFGTTFPIPHAIIDAKHASRIRSLRDPSKKMSKSDVDPKSTIFLLDEPHVIVEKFKKAITDFTSDVTYNPEARPGVSNLIAIHHLVTGTPIEVIVSEANSIDTGKYKLRVANAVVEHLSPIRSKIQAQLQKRNELIYILEAGADRARQTAQATMFEVKQKIGLGALNTSLLNEELKQPMAASHINLMAEPLKLDIKDAVIKPEVPRQEYRVEKKCEKRLEFKAEAKKESSAKTRVYTKDSALKYSAIINDTAISTAKPEPYKMEALMEAKFIKKESVTNGSPVPGFKDAPGLKKVATSPNPKETVTSTKRDQIEKTEATKQNVIEAVGSAKKEQINKTKNITAHGTVRDAMATERKNVALNNVRDTPASGTNFAKEAAVNEKKAAFVQNGNETNNDNDGNLNAFMARTKEGPLANMVQNKAATNALINHDKETTDAKKDPLMSNVKDGVPSVMLNEHLGQAKEGTGVHNVRDTATNGNHSAFMNNDKETTYAKKNPLVNNVKNVTDNALLNTRNAKETPVVNNVKDAVNIAKQNAVTHHAKETSYVKKDPVVNHVNNAYMSTAKDETVMDYAKDRANSSKVHSFKSHTIDTPYIKKDSVVQNVRNGETSARQNAFMNQAKEMNAKKNAMNNVKDDVTKATLNTLMSQPVETTHTKKDAVKYANAKQNPNLSQIKEAESTKKEPVESTCKDAATNVKLNDKEAFDSISNTPLNNVLDAMANQKKDAGTKVPISEQTAPSIAKSEEAATRKSKELPSTLNNESIIEPVKSFATTGPMRVSGIHTTAASASSPASENLRSVTPPPPSAAVRMAPAAREAEKNDDNDLSSTAQSSAASHSESSNPASKECVSTAPKSPHSSYGSCSPADPKKDTSHVQQLETKKLDSEN